MFSSEFRKIFDSYPHIQNLYLGNFSADRLPKKLQTNQFAIINTAISPQVGHWYCLFKYLPSSLEVFDSLGIDNSKKQFILDNFKFRGIREVEFNTTQFQKNDSDTCGKFVLYFIINRLYNLDHSFKDILNEIFENDQNLNETKVENFYQKINA